MHNFYPNQSFYICEMKPTVDFLNLTIRLPTYTCPNAYVIPSVHICDDRWNCPDGSDEQNCPQTSQDVCSDRTCKLGLFQCFDVGVIHANNLCDSIADCADESDERNCPVEGFTDSGDRYKWSTPPSLITQQNDSDFIPCRGAAAPQWYKRDFMCQYDTTDNNTLAHCSNGEHLDAFCEHITCSHGYKCHLLHPPP